MADTHDESPVDPAPSFPDVPTWTPMNRPPTVDDLRFRICWICREEERRETPTSNPSGKTWVHPCNCSLVAHEDCLLTFVTSQMMNHPRSDALQCPQCKTKFQLKTRLPRFLKAFDSLHELTSHGARILTITVASATIYVACTAYGIYAVNAFFGPEMGQRLSGGTVWPSWSIGALINMPGIPLYLVLKNSKLVGSRINSINPFLIQALQVFIEDFFIAGQSLRYPPHPSLLVLPFPFIRAGYLRLHKKVTDYVMSRREDESVGLPAENLEHLENVHAENHEGEGGDNPAVMVEVQVIDVGPNGEQNGDQRVARPEQENQEDWVDALDRGEDLTITGTNVCRLLVGSLSLPFVANIMGRGLYWLSGYSWILRKSLGIEAHHTIINNSPWLRAARAAGLLSRTETLDPVWWRNSIGLTLFVVGRDLISLAHRYLRARERRSRRIVSKPFQNIDFRELELF